MAERDGAAMRRRQRRLRSWWRHEQQSIAAVLATVSHHSYPQVDTAYDGLRAQRTVTSTGEVEAHEVNAAPRGQKEPPPGARPGILAELAPQRSDRSLRHSSGGGPLLVVASLAAVADDGVDAATLSFLTARALEDIRGGEEEEGQGGAEGEAG